MTHSQAMIAAALDVHCTCCVLSRSTWLSVPECLHHLCAAVHFISASLHHAGSVLATSSGCLIKQCTMSCRPVIMHSMSTKFQYQSCALQGALAPFAASAALFAGYLVVKFFPNLNLQAFLNAYFWLIGSIAIFGALQSPLRQSVRGKLGFTWSLSVGRCLVSIMSCC